MFAESLKELRNRKELSIKELSEITKVPVKLLKKYEAGKALPSDDILGRICNYFKVDKNNLLPKEEARIFYSQVVKKDLDNDKKKLLIPGIIIYSVCLLLYVIMIILVFVPLGEHCIGVYNPEKDRYISTMIQISWVYCLTNKMYDYKFMTLVLVLLGLCPGLSIYSFIQKRTKVLFWILNIVLVLICVILFLIASFIPFAYKAC
jgi:transcriptional regulator with XRE-family HTH domain